MKKIIMALMCAAVSLTITAQPRGSKAPKQGENPVECQRPTPRMRMMPQVAGDIAMLRQAGLDSVKIRQVMELRKQNRKAQRDLQEKYKNDLRQLIGDEAYIKYLEAKVAKKNRKAVRQGKRGRKAMMRRGMRGQRPMMMRPGMHRNPQDSIERPTASKAKQAKKAKKADKKK